MTNRSSFVCDLLSRSSGPLSWACDSVTTVPRSSSQGDPLSVRFGQRTFDAEGQEKEGRFFSRKITYPGGSQSGVTIGRGYDMGRKTARQVVQDMTSAGMPEDDAYELSRAAGLRGKLAAEFVQRNISMTPMMSLDVQKTLFEDVVTPELVGDIKRIFNKPDTVSAYGRASWEDLSPAAQELVFDLRYRGDYTPITRKRLQGALVEKNYEDLRTIINDTKYWSELGVPSERIKERQLMSESL